MESRGYSISEAGKKAKAEDNRNLISVIFVLLVYLISLKDIIMDYF